MGTCPGRFQPPTRFPPRIAAMKHLLLAALLFVLIGFVAHHTMAGENDSLFATPLAVKMLNPEAFAQWVSGVESRSKSPTVRGTRSGPASRSRNGTACVSARASTRACGTCGSAGAAGADGRGAGSRRRSLQRLKPDAAYPGNWRRCRWLAAERIKDGRCSREETGQQEYAVWVLPPGTTTRALRFTHTAEATETT